MDGIRRVRVLPDAIANRIAAGEVVERPASVVKELMENSIDAGARKISVSIEKAGKARICVSDDGSGMDEHDAMLAVQRHATSKIGDQSDLFAIRTLGFRGEALPSVASVSLFTITSRAGDDAATRIYIEGGELQSVEQTAFPVGCEVDVRKLFYNTPARMKFMKSDSAESAAISEVVNFTALAHPEIRIKYSNNGRDIFSYSATDDATERIAAVMGKSIYPKLFPVSGERGGLSLEGMISAPDLTRPNQARNTIFLNGRPIKDRSLQYAVSSAYGTLLDSGRFPIAVLMLSIPPDLVDVNVHPAKSEVRFSDPRLIYRFIHESVREALGRSPWLGGVGSPSEASAGGSRYEDRIRDALGKSYGAGGRQRGFAIGGGHAGHGPGPALPSDPALGQAGNVAASGDIEGLGFFSSLTVLAQLHGTYILVSTPRGLGIIDQHAAHERITFERLLKQHELRRMERQGLLFPVRVDLDERRRGALIDFADDIASLGFEVEEFGGDSVSVRAVPRLLGGGDVSAMLCDLLDELADVLGSRAVDQRIEKTLATLACHASVRANDALNYEQMIALLKQMDSIDHAASCPHGRPVFIEIGKEELERRFGRVK